MVLIHAGDIMVLIPAVPYLQPAFIYTTWDRLYRIGKPGLLVKVAKRVNPYPAKLIYLNFHPLEVVSRHRDPQLQVGENYSYLFNLRPHICKSWCLDTHFIHNKSDLVD